MMIRNLTGIIGLGVLFVACSGDPLDIPTDNVAVSITFTNLDSLLVNTDTTALLGAIMDQRARMPEIIDYELGYCLNAGMVTDPGMVSHLSAFRNDPYIHRLEQRIAEKFHDLHSTDERIINGFKHLKAHLPQAKIPENVVYLNSFFTSSAFCTEKEIALGLDRYLGAKTDVITELPDQEFYDWIKQGMEPEYLERDALASWIMTHVVPEPENPTTAEAMIYWGKILYLTEAAFPDLPEHIILRHTEIEYNWAIQNERLSWDYLVEHKLLFEHDEQTRANLLKEGPFTPGLPGKAPDRLGQFIGWRILHSYMEQYDVTLSELMALPYTELLQEYEIAK